MNHHAPNHYGHGVTRSEIEAPRRDRDRHRKEIDDLLAAFDSNDWRRFHAAIDAARIVLTTEEKA